MRIDDTQGQITLLASRPLLQLQQQTFAQVACRDAGRVDEVGPENLLDYLLSEMTFDDSSLMYVPHAKEFVVNAHTLGTRMLWRLGADHQWVQRCIDRDRRIPKAGGRKYRVREYGCRT